jgi:hypothetical protein
MTDQDIYEWGDRAEALLNHPDYNLLYDKITEGIAHEILATPYNDHEYRKELYHTYNGMRMFAYRLKAMVDLKKQRSEALDAEANLNEEDRD